MNTIITEFLEIRTALLKAGISIEKVRPFAMRKDEFTKLSREVPGVYSERRGSIINIVGLRCYVVDKHFCICGLEV
ncbi:hypothetical protein LCGC14_2695650 [marine sediment metagenome]|uniref:Uncharacterized protein n=1 Tax=marine sediment metagenome TaxID=412755 RepID=A0A0F8ZH54_9ZZZZ